jgi:hypothetical protein
VLKLGMYYLDEVAQETVVRPTDYSHPGAAFPGVIPPIF